MKKIICMLLAVMLIASMAIPAYAVTPKLEIPDVPQISKIKFNVKIELPDDFWDNWFKEHPIDWRGMLNSSATEELKRWES